MSVGAFDPGESGCPSLLRKRSTSVDVGFAGDVSFNDGGGEAESVGVGFNAFGIGAPGDELAVVGVFAGLTLLTALSPVFVEGEECPGVRALSPATPVLVLRESGEGFGTAATVPGSRAVCDGDCGVKTITESVPAAVDGRTWRPFHHHQPRPKRSNMRSNHSSRSSQTGIPPATGRRATAACGVSAELDSFSTPQSTRSLRVEPLAIR